MGWKEGVLSVIDNIDLKSVLSEKNRISMKERVLSAIKPLGL